MIIIDPQQELFSQILVELLKLKEKGWGVYDGQLPPDGTPYPFIYLADNTQDDTMYKNGVTGEVDQVIHVYHNNPKQRGAVSQMLTEIKKICLSVKSNRYKWMLTQCTQRIMPDNTTKEPLLHGHLEVTYKFS